MRNAIFWPLIAQVALVAAVWLRMGFVRIGEMMARRVHPQKMANSRTAAAALEKVTAADNFRNLFEMPVLFFCVCCVLAITETVTPTQVTLAWMFVGLRAAHSFIHVTYNRVMHRFVVYVLGSLCVYSMWALFAVSLLRS